MKTILIIEDEPAIADTIVYALESDGYRTRHVELGAVGVQLLRDEAIALVVLDVGLPDGNGFEFCKEIRSFSDVPVIFLTARNDEIDRIVGLEIGADDYVVKPFSPRELTARVRVILRRARPSASTVPVATDFAIDRSRSRIEYRGEKLELTKSELLILIALLERPEQVLSREQIMQHAWDEPGMSQARAVDTHIKSLRAKLRAVTPEYDPIETHRGLGYSVIGSVREL